MIKLINKKEITNIGPLRRSYKKLSVGYINPIPEATPYEMTMEITGNPGDNCVLLSTGYKDKDEFTNTFVLSQNDLSDLIEQLNGILEECKLVNACYMEVQRAYLELYKYIDMGIIEGINLHKIANEYPNYSPMLYTPFRIEPKFKSAQEIRKLESMDEYKDIITEINIGLHFIDCFHIDFNNANPMINKLTNNHPDIPITFSNYDLNAEYKKYRDKIMEEVKGFLPKDKKKHDEKMLQKAKELGLSIGLREEDLPQIPNNQ